MRLSRACLAWHASCGSARRVQLLLTRTQNATFLSALLLAAAETRESRGQTARRLGGSDDHRDCGVRQQRLHVCGRDRAVCQTNPPPISSYARTQYAPPPPRPCSHSRRSVGVLAGWPRYCSSRTPTANCVRCSGSRSLPVSRPPRPHHPSSQDSPCTRARWLRHPCTTTPHRVVRPDSSSTLPPSGTWFLRQLPCLRARGVCTRGGLRAVLQAREAALRLPTQEGAHLSPFSPAVYVFVYYQ